MKTIFSIQQTEMDTAIQRLDAATAFPEPKKRRLYLQSCPHYMIAGCQGERHTAEISLFPKTCNLPKMPLGLPLTTVGISVSRSKDGDLVGKQTGSGKWKIGPETMAPRPVPKELTYASLFPEKSLLELWLPYSDFLDVCGVAEFGMGDWGAMCVKAADNPGQADFYSTDGHNVIAAARLSVESETQLDRHVSFPSAAMVGLKMSSLLPVPLEEARIRLRIGENSGIAVCGAMKTAWRRGEEARIESLPMMDIFSSAAKLPKWVSISKEKADECFSGWTKKHQNGSLTIEKSSSGTKMTLSPQKKAATERREAVSLPAAESRVAFAQSEAGFNVYLSSDRQIAAVSPEDKQSEFRMACFS